jgi:hypothetical protein
VLVKGMKELPGSSCQDIEQSGGFIGDGNYWLVSSITGFPELQNCVQYNGGMYSPGTKTVGGSDFLCFYVCCTLGSRGYLFSLRRLFVLRGLISLKQTRTIGAQCRLVVTSSAFFIRAELNVRNIVRQQCWRQIRF